MNPYHEDGVNEPKALSDLFGNKTFQKSRKTERGELLKYFAEKTGKPIGYMAMRCTKFSVKDLYYIKSSCDQYDGPWSKCFYGSLKTH